MTQTKVLKMEEYCMYFPFSELHGWVKRFAVQPQPIYSEFPEYSFHVEDWSAPHKGSSLGAISYQ